MNANNDKQKELAPNDPHPRHVVEDPDGQPWLTVIRVYWCPFGKRQAKPGWF
jgi:hypothetical protein